MRILKKAEIIIGKITQALAAFCLLAVSILFLLNICTRVSFIIWNPTWIDEVIQFFFVWMLFLGAMDLVRTGEHFMVDILTEKMHGTLVGRIMRLISAVILLITYVVIFYFGILLCQKTSAKVTYTLPPYVKMSAFYSCMPISTFFMSIYAVRDFVIALADLISGGKTTKRIESDYQNRESPDEDERIIAHAREVLKQTNRTEVNDDSEQL